MHFDAGINNNNKSSRILTPHTHKDTHVYKYNKIQPKLWHQNIEIKKINDYKVNLFINY